MKLKFLFTLFLFSLNSFSQEPSKLSSLSAGGIKDTLQKALGNKAIPFSYSGNPLKVYVPDDSKIIARKPLKCDFVARNFAKKTCPERPNDDHRYEVVKFKVKTDSGIELNHAVINTYNKDGDLIKVDLKRTQAKSLKVVSIGLIDNVIKSERFYKNSHLEANYHIAICEDAISKGANFNNKDKAKAFKAINIRLNKVDGKIGNYSTEEQVNSYVDWCIRNQVFISDFYQPTKRNRRKNISTREN